MYAQLHESKPFHDGTGALWSEKPTWVTPFHFQDGVSFHLAETDENPDDDFLNQKRSDGGGFLL